MNTIYEAWVDPGNGDACEDATYIEAESQEAATTYANAQDHYWPIMPPKQHPIVRIECADGRPAYRLLLFPPESNKDQAIIDLVEERAGLQWTLNNTKRAVERIEALANQQNALIASIPWEAISAIVSAAIDAEDRDDPDHPSIEHIAAVNTWLCKQGESK